MFVAVFGFRAAVCIVDMFSISYIHCRRRFTAEFVEVSVYKIGAELDLMHVAVTHADRFTGHGAESVIVAFIAFCLEVCTAKDFVYMTLVIPVIILVVKPGVLIFKPGALVFISDVLVVESGVLIFTAALLILIPGHVVAVSVIEILVSGVAVSCVHSIGLSFYTVPLGNLYYIICKGGKNVKYRKEFILYEKISHCRKAFRGKGHCQSAWM